ncbi:PhoD-like phosphatase N-terminal domain-containing protein [Rhodococcus sp. ACPA4]|uniref:PhoD-like phosphatase N-terminal domain-containing protein n=1 Tax=Rhodococcus sp. ACPA4 TaxID=2028571 RepID=UPI00211C1D25|nr:PhoD-like phosphatase N-terminal domain-containing protein [Rhodococcus sp. ACPA4]
MEALPDAVVISTRITPTTDVTPDSGIGRVVTPNWHVATDEGFATAVASGSVVASASSDHIAKINVTGLDSSTTDCPRRERSRANRGVDRHVCPMHPVAARAPRV